MADNYNISVFLDNISKFCSFTFLELGFEGDFNGGASVSFTRARCGSKCINDIKGVLKEGIKYVDVFPRGIDLLKTIRKDKEACKHMPNHIRTAVNVLNQYFEEKGEFGRLLQFTCRIVTIFGWPAGLLNIYIYKSSCKYTYK